jgi:hypothetical protein
MVNKKLVKELRRLFLDGATPSRLMQHIAKHHPDDPRLRHVIADYFSEAFDIPLLRNVVSDEDYSPNKRHGHFNRDVVPEIIQRIGGWNKANLEGTWLEGLSIKSLGEETERLKSAHFEELDRVWETLNDKERFYIIRKSALINNEWEAMKILAALAERLQAKIDELEDRLKEHSSEEVLSNGAVAPAARKAPRSRN